jgi:hypothetical protein
MHELCRIVRIEGTSIEYTQLRYPWYLGLECSPNNVVPKQWNAVRLS